MKEKDRVGVGVGIRFWPSCAMPTSFRAVTYMEMYYRKKQVALLVSMVIKKIVQVAGVDVCVFTKPSSYWNWGIL